MIYTVTLNPSLDYTVAVEDFALGRINRTASEAVSPGGKGVNVSIMLKNLGIESTVLGFIAGFTGEEIRKRIQERKCPEKLIFLENGRSRINVKIRSNEESELNGSGPLIDSDAIRRLYMQLDEMQQEDILVLAGSVPPSLPCSIYSSIMARANRKGIKTVVDAATGLLTATLQHMPFLVKPNHTELGEIFQKEVSDKKDAIIFGKKLQDMGARNVLVSMAGKGAVLVSEDGQILESGAPKGKLVNSVGAGDSMVAGFLAGFLETGDYRHAFYMGLAAGSASAFSEGPATLLEVQAMYRSLINDRRSHL